MIIISSSGMLNNGRVLMHLEDVLKQKGSRVVLSGYQAEGTLGKKIISGEKCLDIMDEMVDVRAEIYHLDGFSSHADQTELLWWLKGLRNKPKMVFVVHGEKEESEGFAELVEQQLGFNTYIPVMGETFYLKDKEIVTQGMIKDSNKELQLNEILTDLNKIRHKFYLLLNELELSGMDNAFFCNSGAEANEAAIKLARLYGHNKGISLPTIVVMERSFHGRTMATLTASGNRKVQAG